MCDRKNKRVRFQIPPYCFLHQLIFAPEWQVRGSSTSTCCRRLTRISVSHASRTQANNYKHTHTNTQTYKDAPAMLHKIFLRELCLVVIWTLGGTQVEKDGQTDDHGEQKPKGNRAQHRHPPLYLVGEREERGGVEQKSAYSRAACVAMATVFALNRREMRFLDFVHASPAS